MKDPEIITVSIYRSDYRILIAIAKAENLRDLKNHPSIKKAVRHVLQERESCAELPLSEKGSQ